MDANLVTIITGALGITGGVWALVKWRGNGNGHRALESPLEMTRELEANFNRLSGRLDQLFRNAEEDRAAWLKALSAVNNDGGTWRSIMTHQFTELPRRLEGSFERLSGQLDALLRATETSAAPSWREELARAITEMPLEMARIDAAWHNELVHDMGELSRQVSSLGESLRAPEESRAPAWQPPPVPIVRPRSTGDNGGAVEPSAAPPAERQPPLTLEMFNTIAMTANTVYELFPPEAGLYWLNVANLGPGTLYTRINGDPSVGDPQSVTLPIGAADNNIHVPVSLRALADADSTITVRLTTQ